CVRDALALRVGGEVEDGKRDHRVAETETAAEAAVCMLLLDSRVQAIGRICVACLPFGPSLISNSTFWFSFRVLKPEPWISEKWAKRSSPPPSGLMKPKPLESLNHFTVPVLIACSSFRKIPEKPTGHGA